MSRLPILMYHRIESATCPIPGEDQEERRYAVTLAQFEDQIDVLAGSGRVGVSMRQIHDRLASGRRVPEEWVGLTFDDGNTSDLEHATPLLARYGFSATFYVCTCRIDAPGGVTAVQLAEMVAAGMHVGAHGVTHRFLTTLDAQEEEGELRDSRDALAGITGGPVDHFAPPGGRYSERTLGAARTLGFRAVGTSDFGLCARAGERYVYPRLPVMRTTSARHFCRMVSGNPASLLADYARAAILRGARGILGETGYRRLRSRATGS